MNDKLPHLDVWSKQQRISAQTPIHPYGPHRRRMGSGVRTFRAAMMACGLTPLSTAEWLGVSLEDVQHWARGREFPEEKLDMLRDLYAAIVAFKVPKSAPDGAHVMAELLLEWRNT